MSIPSSYSDSGAWNDYCHSQYHQPSQTRARYYTFELTDVAHVKIDLAAGDSTVGLDPFLVLWAGQWLEGPGPLFGAQYLTLNEDNEELPVNATTASRVAMELPAGEYIIEATLDATPVTPSPVWDFTLEVNVAELIPYLGHQADHTVRYRIDSYPPTPTPTQTPTPTYTPTPTPTPLAGHVVPPGPTPSATLTPSPTSTPLPDIVEIYPTAIPFAADAWNQAVATPWPYVFFCEDGSCGGKNTDGNLVVIDVVDGSGDERHKSIVVGSIDWGDWESVEDWLSSVGNSIFGVSHCGRTIVCLKPDPLRSPWNLNPVGNGHMGSLKMIVEQPAWKYDDVNDIHTRIVWTDKVADHDKSVMINGSTVIFEYLPGALMHEFGHAAGLADLYQHGGCKGKYDGYVMTCDYNVLSIPFEDIEYLRQVYRNQHGARPH